MIIAAFAFVGALIGGLNARKRGGTGLDIAQYAGAYALAFGIVGMFITVFLVR
ncbi:MAG: hypothetical protein KDK10_17205 [Maritimibacter sp.]|nr:hypothetical protein [Maritimibacter sp.]